MQLSLNCEYSLRVLIYLGVAGDRRVAIAEIAAAFGISAHHLDKVVRGLTRIGAVEATRGRGGGLRLTCAPENIRVGDIVRQTERIAIVTCHDEESAVACAIDGVCGLKGVMERATQAFLAALDDVSIAQLLGSGSALQRRLGILEGEGY